MEAKSQSLIDTNLRSLVRHLEGFETGRAQHLATQRTLTCYEESFRSSWWISITRTHSTTLAFYEEIFISFWFISISQRYIRNVQYSVDVLWRKFPQFLIDSYSYSWRELRLKKTDALDRRQECLNCVFLVFGNGSSAEKKLGYLGARNLRLCSGSLLDGLAECTF